MTEGRARIVQAAGFLKENRLREAKELAAAVLRENTADVDARHLLGVIALHEQSYAEAERILREVVALRPDLAMAHYNLGNALLKLGRHAEAVQSYDLAIDRNPAFVEALINRGIALYQEAQFEESLACYDRALALSPRVFEALLARGNTFIALRQWRAAERALAEALNVRPDDAPTLNNYGIVLAALQRHGDALLCFNRALSKNAAFTDAVVNRACAQRNMGRFEDARAAYLELLKVNTQRQAIQLALLVSELNLCDWQLFSDLGPRIDDLALNSDSECTPWEALFLLDKPEAQLELARRYTAREYPQPRTPQTFSRRHRLRIAYISADFYEHATAYLIAGLLEAHDRCKFEINAISLRRDEQSPMRRRIEASVDHFSTAYGFDDAEVAAQLRARAIDIAVDLKGHTRGTRMGIFAAGAAPLQVTYLGFPGTSGAPFIDYVLADRHVIPPDEEQLYSERVVWLPECYQVNDAKRPIDRYKPTRADVGLPDAAFVYCCFNNPFKIRPAIFDVWMRLLANVDGSVLWLLESSALTADNLKREARARGIAPERLVFAKRLPVAQHLARIACADLVLDTLPVNAHTTASDALWAGVPVLTCTGTTFAGRVATSLLRAHDLPELVTTSLADYERLAREFSTEPRRLAALREKMRAIRSTVSLFDTDRMARHIETAFTMMQDRLQRGEPPESFHVPALPGGATLRAGTAALAERNASP